MNLPPDGVHVTVKGQELIVYRCGDIYRLLKNGDWKFVNNTAMCNGYNRFGCCNNKIVMRHRVIAYAYLNLDIDDATKQIDHINGNKLCNHVDNLRIVSHQENHHNRTTAKGYCFHKRDKKWHARIRVNNKQIHLGLFNTEEEARQAYLEAKLKFHPTAPVYEK